jgi:hypothetical protein
VLLTAIALGCGFVIGTAIDLMIGTWLVLAILLPIPLGLANLCVIGAWSDWVAKLASPPVQARRYRPQKGTVALRFRSPQYALEMLQGMEIEGEISQ